MNENEGMLLFIDDNGVMRKAPEYQITLSFETEEEMLAMEKKLKNMHRYRRHDLRKNPEDLPKEGQHIIATDGDRYFCGAVHNRCAGVVIETAVYRYNDYRISNEAYISGSDLIAWRELEPFEEE